MLPFFRNRKRIIPEVETIDIFKIEPQSNMMRMIGWITRLGIQRITTSDHGTICCANRVEDWLLKCIRIKECSKWFSSNQHIHFISALVFYHLHFLFMLSKSCCIKADDQCTQENRFHCMINLKV